MYHGYPDHTEFAYIHFVEPCFQLLSTEYFTVFPSTKHHDVHPEHRHTVTVLTASPISMFLSVNL